MERIDELVRAKQNNASIYRDLLKKLYPSHLTFIKELSGTESSHWLFVVKLKDKELTSSLELYLRAHQIETRRIFYPLNIQPAFEEYNLKKVIFKGSTEAYDSGLCLPSSTLLSPEQIQKIAYVITNFFNETKEKS
jgi:dTDP-4-amino-4,6-dideoxygalactose transaminase